MDISFPSVDPASVVKWIIIILITGFITQFGRMLAQYIVKKINERRTLKKEKLKESGSTGTTAPLPLNPDPPKALPPDEGTVSQKKTSENKEKEEKARAKALKKQPGK